MLDLLLADVTKYVISPFPSRYHCRTAGRGMHSGIPSSITENALVYSTRQHASCESATPTVPLVTFAFSKTWELHLCQHWLELFHEFQWYRQPRSNVEPFLSDHQTCWKNSKIEPRVKTKSGKRIMNIIQD